MTTQPVPEADSTRGQQGHAPLVALEEHFWTPAISAALAALPLDRRDDSIDIFGNDEILHRRLMDLGESRLSDMDDAGIDVQVLSVTTPATQVFDAPHAVNLAWEANDAMAAACREAPSRLRAFSTLPTPDPSAAADELTRTVTEHGFVGAMVHSRTGDRLLDQTDLEIVLARAADKGVPGYLPPEIAPRSVRRAYYDGFADELSLNLATGGWGWHMEAGLTALRIILRGTFDRHPDLKIILGHWGEMLLFWIDRIQVLSAAASSLDRPVADYVRENIYVTPSGMFEHRLLRHALEVVGIDHVLFSTDYPYRQPFAADGRARSFVDDAPLSLIDRTKLRSGNARALGLC